MLRTGKDIEKFVNEHGGTIEGGINWTWASFPSNEIARKFHDALAVGGVWETRGVYNQTATQPAGVRFR